MDYYRVHHRVSLCTSLRAMYKFWPSRSYEIDAEAIVFKQRLGLFNRNLKQTSPLLFFTYHPFWHGSVLETIVGIPLFCGLFLAIKGLLVKH